MNNKEIAWKKYFESYCKQQVQTAGKEAQDNQEHELDYGECIYKSPILHGACWIVNKFQNEYNVFVERSSVGSKREKQLVASFDWKDSAMEFVLETFLTLSGYLTRKGEI